MVAALKQLASESQAHAAVQKDMVQELKQLTSDFKTQATLQTAMTEVLKSMHALMISVSAENKKQARCARLQTAWLHAEAGAFTITIMNEYSQLSTTTSTDCARGVLKSFMEGNGQYIDEKYLVREPNHYSLSEAQKNECRAAFRTALVNQIHVLTGSKPRLDEQDVGGVKRWAIYCGE
eukprot:342974-Chlamydomonas_euryale.AAC.1